MYIPLTLVMVLMMITIAICDMTTMELEFVSDEAWACKSLGGLLLCDGQRARIWDPATGQGGHWCSRTVSGQQRNTADMRKVWQGRREHNIALCNTGRAKEDGIRLEIIIYKSRSSRGFNFKRKLCRLTNFSAGLQILKGWDVLMTNNCIRCWIHIDQEQTAWRKQSQ